MELGCSRCGWDEGSCDIHHIDGRKIKDANNHKNLTYVCPNCHRLIHEGKVDKSEIITLDKQIGNTWRDHYYVLDYFPKDEYFCSDCGKSISRRNKSGKCKKCYYLGRRKIKRPPKDILLKELESSSYVTVGKKYGVSDNAIRKWLVS